MSVCRKLADGTVQKIAGHTILLDANAAEIRQGTGHLTMRPDAQFLDSTVTFSDPMPDTDYAVDISFTTEWGISALARVQQKTVTGFKLEGYVTNSIDAAQYGANGWDFKYIAWKPIKLDGYTALQNKVNNPDEVPTENSENLVKSGGVWEAIKNASAVWKGTKAAWEALPAADKMKYDLAVLLDETLVKAVDREDGTETDVANLNKIFRGTEAEWDALTPAQKDEWEQAEIDDGIVISGIPMEYSTTEQDTGMKWIDGKPIYRKMVSCGRLPSSASQKDVLHGITNIDTIIKCSGVAWTANKSWSAPMPFVHVQNGTNIETIIGIYANLQKVIISVGMDRSELTTSYAILEYTKTTD